VWKVCAPHPDPCMGLLLSSPFFGAHVFFNLLVPFLGSTESRFFVPTSHGSMTPRADAVKDGRRAGGSTSSAVARPRLDGGEHGVTLRWSGPRHTHSFFNLSVRESLCSGSVDKPWFKARHLRRACRRGGRINAHHNLVFGGSTRDPNHDAVIRIGGEAPGGGPILSRGTRAMGRGGSPPPRIVLALAPDGGRSTPNL